MATKSIAGLRVADGVIMKRRDLRSKDYAQDPPNSMVADQK